MSRIQYHPRQRITLNEMKYEQKILNDAVVRLYEYLAPRSGDTRERACIIAADRATSVYPSAFGPILLSGGAGGLVRPIFYNTGLAGIRTREGITSFGEMGTSNEKFGVASGVVFDWYSDAINSTTITPRPSCWVNFYLYPRWAQRETQTFNAKYIDKVTTDTSLERVVTKAGLAQAPYPQTGPTRYELTIDNLMMMSATEILGGKQIPEEYTFESGLTDISGRFQQTVRYKDVAVWIGAVYHRSDGTYTSGAYHKISYQPIWGAEMVAYDQTEAQESGEYQSDGANLQDAMTFVGETLGALSAQYISMATSMSAMDDVVHITKSAGDLSTDGYTENTTFPSEIGKRWDK